MPSVNIDMKDKERLKKLGNVSASLKISALLDLCEKHWDECAEEIAKKAQRKK